MKQQFHQSANGWVGALSGGQIPLIVLCESGGSCRTQAAGLVRKLLQITNRRNGTHFFMGIGEAYDTFEQLKQSYHEALLASADVTLPNRHCFFPDLPQKRLDHKSILLEIERDILEQARKGSWPIVQQRFEQLIVYFESEQKNVVESQQLILEMLMLIVRMLDSLGIEVEKPLLSFHIGNIQQLRAEITVILDKIAQQVQEIRSGVNPDVFTKMRQYIMENAHHDISLESIAAHVELSPYYVSKLFKEQFGMNYIDFLTDCRIEKAKQLMDDPHKSLKEITFDVGYKDPNYFSRVFKKISGLSPSEYRKDLLGKS